MVQLSCLEQEEQLRSQLYKATYVILHIVIPSIGRGHLVATTTVASAFIRLDY